MQDSVWYKEKKMETIATNLAPGAIGPYSQAKKVGNFLFCSGQIPLDPVSGEMVGKTIEEQTEQACKNVEGLLSACSLTTDNVIKTTCFLSDISLFGAFNEVYAKHFSSKPARSCVAVKDLPKGALVEIEVICEI